MAVRKGDDVVVTRGAFRGTKGTVTRVDLSRLVVYVDSVKRKKANGQDTEVPVNPSNIKILKLVTDDAQRKQALMRNAGEHREA